MQREKKTRPSHQARERVSHTTTRNDTTALSVMLHVVYKGLFVMAAALLLLLILGPVVLP